MQKGRSEEQPINFHFSGKVSLTVELTAYTTAASMENHSVGLTALTTATSTEESV